MSPATLCPPIAENAARSTAEEFLASVLTRLTILLAAAMIVGCGRDAGPERVVVSGSVTYKGRPVVNGTIRFSGGETSNAPSAGAFIVNGQYNVNNHGGVPVGKHSVQIEAFEQVPAAAQNTSGNEPLPGAVGRGPQFLPEKYNRRTELRFTVPSGSAPIVKNFDLE